MINAANQFDLLPFSVIDNNFITVLRLSRSFTTKSKESIKAAKKGIAVSQQKADIDLSP